MNEYPDIQVGSRWDDVRVRQWHQLIDEHKALWRVVFGADNALTTPSGIRVTARERFGSTRAPDRTVVIVKKPETGHRKLLVREARYRTIPPGPCVGDGDEALCDYAWVGSDTSNFDAFPPLGTKAIEYEGDEEDGSIPAPKLTTTFYRCHREHDVWLLDPPAKGGAAVEHVVVLDIFANDRRLKVHAVSDVDGKWSLVGEDFWALPKPGLQSSDYFAWKWEGAIDQRLTRFLPCYRIRGEWRLGFEMDMIPQLLPTNVRLTDCRPFSRAGGLP